jgi:transcriptional regulator
METYRQLNCKDGCCKDRMTALFEQLFTEQDKAFMALQDEYIALMQFVSEEVADYLEVYARAGDEVARDMLIDLGDFL